MIENSNEDFPEGNIKVVDTSKSEFATVILASTPLWKTAKDKIKSSYAMERLIDEIIKSSIKKDLDIILIPEISNTNMFPPERFAKIVGKSLKN